MHPSRTRPTSSMVIDSRSELGDLEQVYTHYLDPIYRFLYAHVGNREDAEELTSQVFLQAFRQLDVGCAERNIASRLFTIARTTLADHWRVAYGCGRRAEPSETVVKVTAGPDVVGDAETGQRVEEVVTLLPPRYRAVLELRFRCGYTTDETAHLLGISPANVKVIQHRALAKAANLAQN